MQMDELILKLVAKVGEAKSSISSMINLTKNLDDTTSKTAQSFDKMANGTSKIDSSFKESKKSIEELENELKTLSSVYKKHQSVFEDRGAYMTKAFYNPTAGTEKFDSQAIEVITQDKLDTEKSRLQELQQEIDTLRSKVEQQPSSNITDKLVPKNVDNKPLKDIGNKADESSKKVKKLGNSISSLGVTSKLASKGFDIIRNKFSGFTKDFGKSINNNIKGIKKLALGLLGVRTVMSVLTKSVNAYLSFDSELQDSISNSWNMLGSLLAPAIELVANLFATATNYVYRFVQALTGIDLVARANAKAIQTQANKTKKLADAQRGLLSMDEITNLPTESKGGDVSQITVGDIKPGEMFNELLDAFKKQKWHLAGEIIAEGITKGLRSINWNVVREKAEELGHNIASFLNGVFELDWKQVGLTLANGFNTAIDFFYGFVKEIEWGRLGSGIGDAITQFIETFDYKKLANGITTLVTGVFDLMRSALVHLDTEKLGNNIIDFLETIDWIKIAESFVKLLFEAIYKVMVLKLTMFTKIGNDIRDKLKDGIEKLGNKIGGWMGNGVASYLKTAFNLVIEKINNKLSSLTTPLSAIGKITGREVDTGKFQIPYLSTGTPNIESEGLYHLHEGEMVVPKRYNPNTDGYDNGADNKQIIDLLVSLNASMLEYAERPINISMNGRQVAEASYNDFQEVGRNRNQSTAVTRS